MTTLPVSQTVLVNGGPDSLLQLTGQGLLGPGQPAIIAGDPLPARPAQWAVTDGQRRADTLFGLVNSNVSYPYTAAETNPAGAGQLGRAGGPPRQLLPVPPAGHQTVAVLSGAASVTASSYGSWIADTAQDDPVNAFDGDPATAWAEGNEQTPVGQWIQISFSAPRSLPARVGISLLDDSTDREIASQLRVSTAAGSVLTPVAATGAIQPLNVVPGRTSWLRITIVAARRVSLAYPGAGISDVLIPGVQVTRLLEPAEDPAGRQAASVAFSFRQQVPSPAAFADPAATAPMARAFTLAGPAKLQLQAAALALPGPGLDALLDRISPPGAGLLQVSVASTAGARPAGFPASLISGKGGVPWTADDASPVIHLSWPGQRRISSLIVRPAAGLPSTPLTVKITSPAGTRQASIPPSGLVRFTPPLTTDRIDVSFPRVRQATIVTSTGQLETLPVRLSQLAVPALADLRPVMPPGSASFTLPCGQGPALTIDGRVLATSVSGTIGELTQYLPLQVRSCSPGRTLTLGAGRHTLTAAPGTFAVTDLTLTSPTLASPASPTPAPQAAAAPDRHHRQLAAGPQQAQHRPGRGLLPGSPRELQLRLGRHAQRAGPHPGTPRRLAAGLRRAGRPGRHDHAHLPPGRGLSPGPGHLHPRRPHPARRHRVVLPPPSPRRPQCRSSTRLEERGTNGCDAVPILAGTKWLSLVRDPAPGPTMAGRARRHRADLRRGRPGGARRSGPRRPGLAPRAPGRAARSRAAAAARPGRHGGLGSAVRGEPVGPGPARSVRLARAGLRPGRAGRRAAPVGHPPAPAPPTRPRSPAAHKIRPESPGARGGRMSAGPYTGIALALLAATAYNVGLIQEKRALGRMPALDVRRVPRLVAGLLADPAWLAGFALMLVGLACQIVVLSFEPVSVVQPVLASGVALVLVLSRLVLRERLGAVELWCVAALAACVILLAASAGGTGAGAGHHASPGWMAAVAIPSAVIGLLVAASPLRARPARPDGTRPTRPDGTRPGGAQPEGAQPGAHRTRAAVCFGVGTGLLYGVAALAIKALSGILVGHDSAADVAARLAGSPYLYVLGGCSAAAMLLYQVGLQSCRASILVPASTVTGSVYFLITGTWLFHEQLPAGPAKLGLRLAAIAVAGVVLVTLSRQDPGQAAGDGEPGPAPGPRLSRRPGAAVMALEDALLDILVCPIDKRGLLYFADDAVLYNPRLHRLYRIEDGVPLMLASQAVPVPEEEHRRLMQAAVTRITATPVT